MDRRILITLLLTWLLIIPTCDENQETNNGDTNTPVSETASQQSHENDFHEGLIHLFENVSAECHDNYVIIHWDATEGFLGGPVVYLEDFKGTPLCMQPGIECATENHRTFIKGLPENDGSRNFIVRVDNDAQQFHFNCNEANPDSNPNDANKDDESDPFTQKKDQTSALTTVSFEETEISFAESDGFFTLNASLDHPVDNDVRIPFFVSGSATLEEDYTLDQHVFYFTAGSQKAAVDVQVIDDDQSEYTEHIRVQLFGSSQVDVGEHSVFNATLYQRNVAITSATLTFADAATALIRFVVSAVAPLTVSYDNAYFAPQAGSNSNPAAGINANVDYGSAMSAANSNANGNGNNAFNYGALDNSNGFDDYDDYSGSDQVDLLFQVEAGSEAILSCQFLSPHNNDNCELPKTALSLRNKAGLSSIAATIRSDNNQEEIQVTTTAISLDIKAFTTVSTQIASQFNSNTLYADDSDNGNPHLLADPLHNRLYIRGQNTQGHDKLFVYENNSIRQLSNITANNNDNIRYLTLFQNQLYFAANGVLYTYDGTAITHVVRTYSTWGDNVKHLAATTQNLFFTAQNSGGTNVWFRYDGSTVFNITTTAPGLDVSKQAVVHDDKLYSGRNNYPNYDQVYSYQHNDSDGSDFDVDYFIGYNYNSPAASLFSRNSKLLAYRHTTTGYPQIFEFENRDAIQRTNINGYTNSIYTEVAPAVTSQAIYFASNPSHNLMKLENTTVSQVVTSTPNSVYAVRHLFVHNDTVYFAGKDENSHYKLFATDGTKVVKISNLRPNADDFPFGFTLFNGAIYFIAASPESADYTCTDSSYNCDYKLYRIAPL